jgi:hypothetical protein
VECDPILGDSSGDKNDLVEARAEEIAAQLRQLGAMQNSGRVATAVNQ